MQNVPNEGRQMKSYDKTEPSTIRALFDSIAPRYDLGNALLSGMLHKLWNRRLITHALRDSPTNVLDLCAGTGEIARAMHKRHSQAAYHLIDFSEEMLNLAKARLTDSKFSFCAADAESLPLEDACFDAATCAYGIRNIRNREKALQELFRVLKPQATVSIVELTRPKGKFFGSMHKVYLQNMVPLIGRLLTSNEGAYKYLCESIHTFIAPELLMSELQQAGFQHVEAFPQTFGIATIFTAKKV